MAIQPISYEGRACRHRDDRQLLIHLEVIEAAVSRNPIYIGGRTKGSYLERTRSPEGGLKRA